MFSKRPYGATIAPACAYCEFGRPAADPRMILCDKKGAVSPTYACHRYRYDPLARVPQRRPRLPEYTPSDFLLTDPFDPD